jgi:hypothetical protein
MKVNGTSKSEITTSPDRATFSPAAGRAGLAAADDLLVASLVNQALRIIRCGTRDVTRTTLRNRCASSKGQEPVTRRQLRWYELGSTGSAQRQE